MCLFILAMELGSWLFLTLCTANPLLPGVLVTSKRDEALAAQLLRVKSAKVQLKTGCSVTRESRTGQAGASPGNPRCSLQPAAARSDRRRLRHDTPNHGAG